MTRLTALPHVTEVLDKAFTIRHKTKLKKSKTK